MTAPSQADVRNWARGQKLTINGRGSLPTAVVQAYIASHPPTTKGTTVTPTAAKRTARKSPTTRAAKPAPASIAKARKAAPSAAKPPSPAPAAVTPPPAAAGSVDLAGGLRVFLDQVGDEVKAVNTLSARIDGLVHELNGLRDEQAIRLMVLDTLKSSVDDDTLSAFLGKAIRPRMARVEEVFPERLTQA